jgi:transglutaminase-like putative cysteine protease
MSIRVALRHTTRYRYDRPVLLSPQTIRLRPAPHTRTPILSFSLRVTPAQHFLNWQQDPQGNFLARVVFPERTRELIVDVDLTAQLVVVNPFDFFPDAEAESMPFRYEAALGHELAPYLLTEPLGPRLRTWLERIDRRPRRTIDFLVDLNQRLQREV